MKGQGFHYQIFPWKGSSEALSLEKKKKKEKKKKIDETAPPSGRTLELLAGTVEIWLRPL